MGLNSYTNRNLCKNKAFSICLQVKKAVHIDGKWQNLRNVFLNKERSFYACQIEKDEPEYPSVNHEFLVNSLYSGKPLNKYFCKQ